MAIPANFMRNATVNFTPDSAKVPVGLWSAFVVLNQVHAGWRKLRRFSLYTQEQTMAQYVAGQGLNKVISEASYIRVAAQVLLITTRILQCVQAQQALCDAYDAWKKSFSGNYTVAAKVEWRSNPGTLLSPSTLLWFDEIVSKRQEKVTRIAVATLQVSWCLFSLSMRIMDAQDAILWSPESCHEAVTEGFVNGGKWLDAAENNKENLLMQLKTNKAIVEYVLKALPFKYTYKQLHSHFSTALSVASPVNQAYKTVFSPVSHFFKLVFS